MLLNQNRKECIDSEISSGRIRGAAHLYALGHLVLKSSTVGRERSQHLYHDPSFLLCLEKFYLP